MNQRCKHKPASIGDQTMVCVYCGKTWKLFKLMPGEEVMVAPGEDSDEMGVIHAPHALCPVSTPHALSTCGRTSTEYH